MTRNRFGLRSALAVLAAAAGVLVRGAAAANILETTGFADCGGSGSTVTVQRVAIQYNSDNLTVTFDVAGTSARAQNVTAVLNVTAYGTAVYSRAFDPCAADTFVQQLCPLPAGAFAARGSQAIPAQYASLVPAIAFQVPDIAAQATLQLRAVGGNSSNSDDGNDDDVVACIQAEVTNGKTADLPAVSFVAAGVAGAALVLSGVAGLGAALGGAGGGGGLSGSSGGGAAPSPSFVEVVGWFQGMAMNGMLSVQYPRVYRSFAKNFGFATGLVPWRALQTGIDQMRQATGGNLTQNSEAFLHNATLVFADGSTATPAPLRLLRRAIETSVNGTATNSTGSPDSADVARVRVAVSGIQAYVEELSIPSANTFMTVLLVVAIVIAAITVGVLLVKVVLEAWALIGRFPASLAGFRQHYWRAIARAITTLILLLYGVWVLYCMFQFTRGDSWAAKALAGATLGLFTGVLVFFSVQIARTARRLRRADGDAGALYDDKRLWSRYSVFYEAYRRQYWWAFVPAIAYMFAKGVALAAGDGHGLAQTAAQLAIEAAMLALLLWSRPYERRSGNVVNIAIQSVRVLSVVCVFVFVEEFGIAETTQTVAGVVLIAVQSALSGILALLIAWNAVAACIKENPHRRRRKAMEKLRDADNLTPLDARNSLLLVGRGKGSLDGDASSRVSVPAAFDEKTPPATNVAVARVPPARQASTVAAGATSSTLSASSGAVLIGLATSSSSSTPDAAWPLPTTTTTTSAHDGASLLGNVAPMGRSDDVPHRQPTLPSVGLLEQPQPASTGSSSRYAPRGPPQPAGYGYRAGNGAAYPPRSNTYARSNTYSPFPAVQRSNTGPYAGPGTYAYVPYNPGRGYGASRAYD